MVKDGYFCRKRLEDLVQRRDVREVAVAPSVAVAVALAVHPEIVVPLQVVGLHRIDEGRETIHHPLAPRLAREADHRRVVGLIAAVGLGQRGFLEAVLSDDREIHAFRLDPDAELHPQTVRVVGEHLQAVRKPVRVGHPRAEPRVEVLEL